MPTEPPLYQRVKQELLAAIAAGKYSQGKPFITQREICERFGVSHATAVRALNDLAAEGYVVRRRGRGTFVADRPRIGEAGNRTVACIVQNFGPHVSELLAGVEATGAELGYRIYLTHCEDDTGREEQALLAALGHGVSGIIAYPSESIAVAAYTEVHRRRVPLIMVDRYRSDLPTDAVVADNFAAGRDLTAELITAGHRVIATLWDETDTTSVRDRLAGHLQALRDAGIALRPDLTMLRPYRRQPTEERLVMLRQLLSSRQPPTVFLCANGYALATAARDLVDLGLSIPRDIDLAGMDDAGPFDVLPLTAAAVVLPSREMGQAAMQLLHDRVSGDQAATPELVVLPISIRTRNSAPGHLQVIGIPRTIEQRA